MSGPVSEKQEDVQPIPQWNEFLDEGKMEEDEEKNLVSEKDEDNDEKSS